MSFESAGYQLLPVLPELVLAVGAMVLLMLGAYRGQETTRLVTGLAVALLVVVGLLEFFLILAVVHTALTATRITVENGANGARISWRHSILGIGRTRD